MKVFLIRKKSRINAKAEFDPATKAVIVLKGSELSSSVAHTAKFRSANSIEKSREGVMKGNVLLIDVAFKSASTAANFVTGSSTNGLTAWKDSDGKTIKDIISQSEVE